MAIRKLGSDEQITLDQPAQQTTQSSLRKLAPDEQITLDADRAVMNPRNTTPIYYPQQEADTSIVGHLKAGAVDATRRMYGLSANLMDMAADKVDEVQYAAQNKYYDIFGYPEAPEQAMDEITGYDGSNPVSRGLRDMAMQDSQGERILAGNLDRMNVQDTVNFDDVKADPLSLKTGRFILEQGARSLPEMGVAMIPYVGLPTVMGTTTQNVLEERNVNQGQDANTIPTADDLQTAVAYAAPSAALERLGALGDVAKPLGGTTKQVTKMSEVPSAMARSAAGEGATEFIQENLELAGATHGTDVNPSLQDRIDVGIQGAMVGGPMGASIRGGTETIGLARQEKTVPLMIEDGRTEQDMGTDAQQQAPVSVEVPVNRDNLADAINNDTELPQSRTIELPQVDIDPVLQEAGFVVGADVEQVTDDGEVITGVVSTAQLIDGELEVTVVDANGDIRTLFASDGDISVAVQPETTAEQPIEEPVAPSPEPVPQAPAEPQRSKQDEFEAMGLEQLTSTLQNIKTQAKSSGWNKMTTEMARKVKDQLDTRFPEWDIPAKVDVAQAAEDVNPEPTDAQKEAGNYKKGHVSVQGLPITLENTKGSPRRGTDPNGEQWEVEMPAHYGYIKRTEGADSEQVDVYVGDTPSAPSVFIVDQVDADNRNFDEHKAFIGFENADQVKATYNSAFNDGRGIQRYGGMTEMTVPEFKDWLKNGNNKKPLKYQKPKPQEFVPQGPVVAKEMIGEREYNALDRDQQLDITMMSVRWRDSIKEDGKADPIAARVGEAFSIAEAVELQYGNTKMADALRKDALSIAKRYGKALYDNISKPVISTKIRTDERRLAKKIEEAHDFMDAQDAQSGGGRDAQLQDGNTDTQDSIAESQDTVQETENTETSNQQVDLPLLEPQEQEAPNQPVEQNEPREEATQEAAPPEPSEADGGAETQDARSQSPQEQIADKKSDKTVKEKQTTKKSEKINTEEKIEDFGEKLEGARKHTWEAYNSSLTSSLPEDNSKITMAKHFPEPNYEQLIDDGMDVERLATFKAIRDEVKNKPRQPYKLARWIDDVKQLRELAHSILNDQKAFENFKSEGDKIRQLGDFFDRIELYKDLGYPAFTKAKDWTVRKSTGVIENGVKIDRPVWFVAKGTAWGTRFDSYEEGVQALKAELANAKNGKKRTKLDVYIVRATKEVIVGKKVAAGKFIDLKGGFKTSRDAHKYLRDNYDDLVELLEKKKTIAPMRRSVNEPRIGEDYRNGENVSPEKFSETFGFRGVQFGNYVEQSKRVEDLNNAFDGLTDMAKIIGVPEKALSLNGQLGLAFGARGKGAAGGGIIAKAHYEPDHVVINLTKKSGAGSLGHEWWHSLDNYFGKMNEDEFITERPYPRKYTSDGERDVLPVREEVVDAYKDVVKAIRKDTKIEERSQKLDKLRSKDYYSTVVEMTARAFEGYLIYKAEQKGGRNDYLANISSREGYEAIMGEGTYPYPLDSEIDTIVKAYDKLFEVIQTRETEDGIAMFSLADQTVNGLQSQLLQAAKDMKQEKGTGAQILAMLRKSSGIKEEEIAWTGLDDFLKNRGGVTKDEVVKYLEENQVQIEEVTLDDSIAATLDERNAANADVAKANNALVAAAREIGYSQVDARNLQFRLIDGRLGVSDLEPEIQDEARALMQADLRYDELENKKKNATKYSQYTLPGGDNYREVLLTLKTSNDPVRISGYVLPSSETEVDDILTTISSEGLESLDYGRVTKDDGTEIIEFTDVDSQNYARISRILEGYGQYLRSEKRTGSDDTFTSNHYSQENILAHVRLNDRTTADGKKVLFMEEVQSDWHQAGRKRGYKKDFDYSSWEAVRDEDKKRWLVYDGPQRADENFVSEVRDRDVPDYYQDYDAFEIVEAVAEGIDNAQNDNSVPDAPFKKNWHEMVFRRVAQMAAQNGYDAVAWTPGEVQNERYDLSHQVEELNVFNNGEGKWDISARTIGERRLKDIATGIKTEKLSDYIGKELADRAIKEQTEKGWKTYKGLDLKIGGDGMKGFYDKILKKYAEKFGKKYGSSVGMTPIVEGQFNSTTKKFYDGDREISPEDAKVTDIWSMPITESMREAANAGFALFRKTDAPVDAKFAAKMEKAINARLKALGWPQANFRISNDLTETFGVSGVEGAYWRGIIHVSMQAKDILGTINHEVVHGLKAFGAFTDAEWSNLEKRAPEWRKKYKIDENYADVIRGQGVNNDAVLEAKLNEEAIAHAFQDFSNKGFVRRLANRAVRFIKAVREVLSGKPYNFNDANSVFNAIESGKISERVSRESSATADFPMYNLSRRKGPALQQAKQSLAEIKGLENTLTDDLKRLSSWVLHPQQIATLYKDFTPVYRAVIERFKNREVLVHQLTKNIDLYNKLDESAKKNINAALEIGRLTGKTFKAGSDGTISVKNEGLETTVHSKDGDAITLTPTEAAAYEGVRRTMDMALDKYMETILEEYGLLEKGVESAQDVEKLRLKAAKDGNNAEVRRFKEILQRLNDVMDAKKKGYIPFKRWGDVGVSVKDADGEMVHFERVEIPGGLKKWMREKTGKVNIGSHKEVQNAVDRLSEQYDGEGYEINFFEMNRFEDVSANIDLRSLDILASSSEMSEKDYKALREMLEKEMKKKGFRSHFFRSRDVPGYSDDFERAINDYVITISSYISRRMHEQKIEDAVSMISQSGKPALYEYAQEYQEYSNDPKEELATIRMMGFFWYLAGNISSGLVNLTQPFLVTAPWFSAKFDHKEIGKQMSKAYADAGKIIDPKQAHLDFFDFNKAPSDIKGALIKAYEEGDFLSMATHDAMAISNSQTTALRGLEKKKRWVQDAIGLTFSIPEKTNRVVTFIAAYRLALDPKAQKKIKAFVKNDNFARSILEGKTGEDFAFSYAELAVVSTQYRVGKLNRPKMSRGLMSLPTQFWSFMMQTFELMYKLSKVNGGRNKTAVAAMMLSIVAVAGLKGIPFEDDLQDLIERLYKFRTGKDLDIDTKTREFLAEKTNPFIAETLIKGAPASVLNLDMSGRLGFGNVAPDRGSDFLGVWWDMLYERPVRAAQYANKGDVVRAVAEVSPAFLRNPMTAYTWAEDGIRTQKGSKVLDSEDVSNWDVGLKFFGFTTSKVSRKRDEIWAASRANTAVDDLRGRYYSRIAKALAERNRLFMAGDQKAAQQMSQQIEAIMDEIRHHNATHPLHERIFPNEYTIKQRYMEEMSGADARRTRKQARPRRQELKEIYSTE